MSSRIAAQEARRHPLELWRVEQLGWDGNLQGAVDVCVDQAHLAGFRRPAAEVNDRPCVTYGPAIDRTDAFVTRCAIDERHFILRVTTKDDSRGAFETRFSLMPLDQVSSTAVQTRRYRREGACPAGWRVGRQRIAPVNPAGGLKPAANSSPS